MRKIFGYDYFADEHGNVFNKKMKKLKPRVHSGGYLRVNLCKNGKSKDFYIHRIVAELFIDKKQGLNEVNHIDSDKRNNCVSNLEWCNGSMNHEHSLFAGTKTRGSQSKTSKLRDEQVLEIRESNLSQKALASIYGVSRKTIQNIKGGKKWRWL